MSLATGLSPGEEDLKILLDEGFLLKVFLAGGAKIFSLKGHLGNVSQSLINLISVLPPPYVKVKDSMRNRHISYLTYWNIWENILGIWNNRLLS